MPHTRLRVAYSDHRWRGSDASAASATTSGFDRGSVARSGLGATGAGEFRGRSARRGAPARNPVCKATTHRTSVIRWNGAKISPCYTCPVGRFFDVRS